jgi:hypothetical protein
MLWTGAKSFEGYARKQIYALYELLSTGSSRGKLLQAGHIRFPIKGTRLHAALNTVSRDRHAHGSARIARFPRPVPGLIGILR